MDIGEISESSPWEGRVSPEQLQRFEAWISEIFEAMGMPRETAGTRRTPARFLAALHDSTEGYESEPGMLTSIASERVHGADPGRQVVEGPIRFHALCEHHALPFFGQAFVGHVGPTRTISPGGLTTLVRVCARRFTVQERVGEQIVDALEGLVPARGLAVVLRCVHLCTQLRGATGAGGCPQLGDLESSTPTAIWRGAYVEDPRLRSEFLGVCGLGAVDAATPFGGR
jgi:GTP cyclohydrolase IA